MAKVLLGLLAAIVATVFAARLAFDLTSQTVTAPANQPWAQNRMEFVAWNDERWTAWIRDSVFVQLPQDTRQWSRHSNASLAFTDWEGEAWQAKIDGQVFLLARRGNWKAPVERAAAIRYRDWTGKKQLRTVVQLRR